jgi:phage tail-like protein
MPSSISPDPFRGFRFRVEITGIILAGFSEATVPDITVETVDYREGNDLSHRRTLSGLTTYGRIILKRGLTQSQDLYNWHSLIVEKGTSAPNAKRNASITLVDTDGSTAAHWSVFGAWPSRYETSGLNASGSEVMIETLECVIDSMTRTK